jgi:RNA polymerase sigma-70 factor, ECF subfamily
VRRFVLSSRPATAAMNHPEPTDSQVADAIARTRSGSDSALATLYGWYAPDLLRLLSRLLASRAAAEDIVHDLFVGLPEHLARYREQGKFRAWLRATAVGMARMANRREHRRSEVLAREVLTGEAPATATFVARDPHAAIDIERAVANLPEPLRQVFVLKQWEGYTHDEIARLLDISAGASRVRHSRALDALRTSLDR